MRRTHELLTFSRMNNSTARAMPTLEAAIRLTVSATATTATMTTKSRMVERLRSNCRLCTSNMRTPMTIRMAANAAMGIHAITEPSRRNARSASTPSIRPEVRVCAPLEIFTSVAPMVPAPGIPPTRVEARLPSPWPISSRLESWRLRVSESSTTQVLSVSIESSTASVSAGTSRSLSSARSSAPTLFQRVDRESSKPASDPPTPPRGPMISELPLSEHSDASAKPSPT